MSQDYIKALSVRNSADMVYARQVFHEPGMLNGFHLAMMPEGVLAIPDGGWIVWLASEGAIYTWLYGQQFRNLYILYDDLPPNGKAICDVHPSYDEWVDTMEKQPARAGKDV